MGGKQSYIGTKFLNTIKIKLVLFQDAFKLQFMLIIIQGKSLGKKPTKYSIKNNNWNKVIYKHDLFYTPQQ